MKIEVDKQYQWHYQVGTNTSMLCVARYENGGVCVSLGKTFDGKLQINTCHVEDDSLKRKLVFEYIHVMTEAEMNLAFIELRLREISNIAYNMKSINKSDTAPQEEFRRIQAMAEEAIKALKG